MLIETITCAFHFLFRFVIKIRVIFLAQLLGGLEVIKLRIILEIGLLKCRLWTFELIISWKVLKILDTLFITLLGL